jgi:two-component system response regulator FixJ
MTPHAPIVFVVHDNAETRDHIRDLVEATGLQVRTYADAGLFLDELPVDQPGGVVIGTQVCSQSAAEVQQAIARRGARLPTIVVARDGDVSSAVSALKAGALDVIEAPLSSHRTVPVVLHALAADLRSRSSLLEQDDIRLRYAQLTPRECEVLDLVIAGQKSSLIAKRLGICEKTVEIYRSHINKKMRVRNAVQLACMMHSVT